MFCPNDECPDFVGTKLRAEYRPDIAVCPYCGTTLVAHRPAEAEPPQDGLPAKPRVGDDEVMEPVVEASDLAEIAVIKSLLDGAGIPYLALGEERFDAFRGSLSPLRFNPRAGSVTFMVPAEFAEVARDLLVEFDDEAGEAGDEGR